MATKAKAKKAKAKSSAPKSKFILEYKGEAITVDGVIHVIDLGRELLVVRVNEYKKKRSLDIRRLWHTDAGEWAPGKGTSVPADEAAGFLKFLSTNAERITSMLGGSDDA